jgi:hypothetical protein
MGLLYSYLFGSAVMGFAIALVAALISVDRMKSTYNRMPNEYYFKEFYFDFNLINYINSLKIIFISKVPLWLFVSVYFISFSIFYPILVGICLIPSLYLYIFRIREDKVEE